MLEGDSFVVCFKTKVQCSSSDKGTCVEPFCYFTKNSTDAVKASYGCKQLTKPLMKINVRNNFRLVMFD